MLVHARRAAFLRLVACGLLYCVRPTASRALHRTAGVLTRPVDRSKMDATPAADRERLDELEGLTRRLAERCVSSAWSSVAHLR
jgi:hypothetical protein